MFQWQRCTSAKISQNVKLLWSQQRVYIYIDKKHFCVTTFRIIFYYFNHYLCFYKSWPRSRNSLCLWPLKTVLLWATPIHFTLTNIQSCWCTWKGWSTTSISEDWVVTSGWRDFQAWNSIRPQSYSTRKINNIQNLAIWKTLELQSIWKNVTQHIKC